MSVKTMLMILAGTTVTGSLITLVALFLWYNHPQALGLPAPVVPVADSVKVLSPADSLRLKSDSLQKVLTHIQDSLHQISGQLTSLEAEHTQTLANVQADKNVRERREAAAQDTSRLKNLRFTADMYEKAQASEVAKILAGSDEKYSARVLKLMKPKSAAKIIELMPTRKAVDIARLMEAN